MFCIHCGEENEEDSKYCKNCGKEILETKQKNPIKEIDNKMVHKWSWGGFTLSWIYLAGMSGGWLILLFLILNFIPIVNLIGAIYLGIEGRKIAWERRKWKDNEEFEIVQQKWDAWGIVIIIVSILISVLAALES